VIRAAPAAASGVKPPVGAGSNPAGALAAGGVGNDPPLAAANVAGEDSPDDTGDEALPAAAVVSFGAADSVAGGVAGGAPDAGTSGTAASAAVLVLLTAAVVYPTR